MLPAKLAFSNFRVHRVRVALTIAAIALSVSLVVAVTSGYTSARAAAHKVLAMYLGTTDVQITHENDAHGGVTDAMLERVRQDPDVESAQGRLEVDLHLLREDGAPIIGRAVQVIGLNRPHDKSVDTLRMTKGGWFNRADGNDAVVDQVAAQKLGVEVGGTFLLPSVDRRLTMNVVGIVHKPGLLAAQIQTVYVPLTTLQQFMFPDRPQQLSRILIDLKPGTDHDAFVARWQQNMSAIDANLRVRPTSDNRKELDRGLQGLQILSYLGGTVSMLAATFIVFSALSMGVVERQRTLAMLRAIGALRGQLGWLVVCEGVLLAGAGVIVGVPLGILWIHILAWNYEMVFTAGAVLSHDGIAAAGIGAILTALAASLLPAINAMRASPLDAMSPLAQPHRARGVLISALVGLVLICIDPLILFLPLNRSVQFYAHLTIGLGGVMIGCFLLAPLVVWLSERILGPIIAGTFGINYALLRQQLSGGIWRAAGTCAALMVGLSILVVTQTQGTSAIYTWKLPERFPDIFIWSGWGLGPEEQQKLAEVPGIKRGQLMPIAVASPEFGSNFWAIVGAAIAPDATMFFGIDPDLALEMLDLDFRQGNAEEAKRLLKLGQHIVITQEFRQLKGLGVGDKLPLKTNKGVVEFTVAGVVWSPGIDVMVGMHDMDKQFEKRTVASLFGTIDDAREYWGVNKIRVFAANLDGPIEKAALVERVKQHVGAWGLDAADVRQIKYGIQKALGQLLLLVSTIAYAAMIVASLGVANTIMASIRSRRWQFGILRSIGVTRGQLLRIVLAEAVLLGLVGIVMGLIAGTEMAINARQFSAIIIGFKPPVLIPWGTIAIGAAAVMFVSFFASLWPAVNVAKSEPLVLLQAGRAAV